MRTITEYEIIRHGIDSADFFQGCGIAFTEYTDVATGVGDTEEEAFEDALDSLAQNDWDTEDIEKPDNLDTSSVLDSLEDNDMDSDYYPQWYVSIRVR